MKRRYCKHVMCQTCMQQAADSSNIGSVYHASIMWGCVPLSASSSLIYDFWSLKHHHSAAMHHHHRRWETQLSYPWKLHACRANNNYFLYIYFYFLLFVFGIVFNCIIQNNSYCLHRQYFSTNYCWESWHYPLLTVPMANASNNSSFTGGMFYPSPR